jgi:hypothetical protein
MSSGARYEMPSRLLHLDATGLKDRDNVYGNDRRLLGMAAWNRLIDFDCT